MGNKSYVNTNMKTIIIIFSSGRSGIHFCIITPTTAADTKKKLIVQQTSIEMFISARSNVSSKTMDVSNRSWVSRNQ